MNGYDSATVLAGFQGTYIGGQSRNLMTASFHDRITPGEIETIWAAARRDGYLNQPEQSLIVHDLDRMRARLALLADAFPSHTLHAIAIKANPLVEVLRVCVDAGCGLEAASLEEVYLALAAACPPARIIFDSPAKTVEEISEALQRGIHLNADNFRELSRIDQALRAEPSRSTMGLRVNPEVGAGRISHTSVAGSGSKFGVSISRERHAIIQAFRTYRWLTGLHIHVGSQGCDLDLLCEAAKKLQELRAAIESETGRRISLVDIGGGLPAAYRTGDEPPTPHAYVAQLRRTVPELIDGGGRLVTEFGRAVQAGCGVALSRVEYVRDVSEGHYLAVIHLGADFLLRPVYRDQDWKHEFVVLDREGKLRRGQPVQVTIAGPLCFAGDLVARQLELPAPLPGDWIAIRDCGAYTLSMWSRHCSRGIPNVTGYEQGRMRLLRKRETPDDIVRFWAR